MISVKNLWRLPSNWSHKFGEVEFPSTETAFTDKVSKANNKPRNKKEVRIIFKKLLLLKKRQKKNLWYEYKYDKDTNKISFVTP